MADGLPPLTASALLKASRKDIWEVWINAQLELN